MFGARFDPSALEDETSVQKKVQKRPLLKRRLSETSIKESEDENEEDSSSSDSSSDSDSGSSSDSDSDSDSSSDSDSDSSDSSDSDSEVESEDIDNKIDVDEQDQQIEEEIIEKNIQTETTPESKPDEDSMDIDEAPPADADYLSKHSAIFQKFKKSVPESKTEEQEDLDEGPEEAIEEQDLKPLPQPELPRDKRLISTSAHLKNLDWLTEPQYSSPTNTKPFEEFGLSPFMLKNLANQNFKEAFSVQVEVLTMLLDDIKQNKLRPDMKGDILVNAATGSGKTLAYSIPIIEDLSTRVVPRVRAIVLVPTKPLINQVRSTLASLSKGTNLTTLSLKSDISIKEEGAKLLANEPDIIVTTPGRLVEHITNNSISLKALKYLVIDEADRLLNQSFQNWCKILISKLEEHTINISKEWRLTTKKLIFSATLTTDAGKLSALKFQQPRLIIVNDQKQLVNEIFSVPSTLTEFKIQFGTSKASVKPLILTKFLLKNQKKSNVLIFTKSNEASLRLAKLLELLLAKLDSESYEVAYINSTNNKTSIRSKILKDFSTQKVNFLVATDLIARGIDILSITDIINYDLPNSSREYVHRVGRTARANQDGNAYNFCFGKGESKWFKSISRDVGRGERDILDLGIDASETITKEDEAAYEECLEELQKQVFNN